MDEDGATKDTEGRGTTISRTVSGMLNLVSETETKDASLKIDCITSEVSDVRNQLN